MTPSKLEKAILLTVSYSNIFDFPLKKEEIKRRLIGSVTPSFRNLEKILAGLIEKKLLFEKEGFYFLKSSKNTVSSRKRREKIALKKSLDAQKFINFARKIPFIKAIVVTGSLSTNNTNLNDDVDWLIISSKHRLWIARPLVLLVSTLFNRRRRRNGDHRDNSWCFNMLMEESSLSLPLSKKNIYTAYEVCQAKFVFDRGSVEELFLRKNRWASERLANFYEKRREETDNKISEGVNKNANERSLFGFFTSSRRDSVSAFRMIGRLWERFIDELNRIFYIIQYQYMKKNITNETVTLEFAFFHPRDTRGKIMKKWRKILQKAVL